MLARGPNGQIKKKPKGNAAKRKSPVRRDQSVSEVISPTVPQWQVVKIRINQRWQADGMATIQLLQRDEGQYEYYRLAVFLVDIMGVGLKDAFVRSNVSPRALDRMGQRWALAEDALTMVSCSEELMHHLVFGGIAWAHRHGFHIPTEALRVAERVLGPVPDMEAWDLSGFGYEGKPMIIGPFRG